MLAVFDVDGTLCDTQHVEGRCYASAIERVTGLSLDTLDWSAYDEPTSSAIVRHLLDSDPKAIEKEEKIKSEFCRLLQEERPSYPGDFVPVPGAVEFLERLSAEKVCEVAIATGCFDVTARFKLECCGIGLDQYPNATSSEKSQKRHHFTGNATCRIQSFVSCVLWRLAVGHSCEPRTQYTDDRNWSSVRTTPHVGATACLPGLQRARQNY